MIYRVLLNLKTDQSARSKVFLKDYEEIGTIEATSKVLACAQLASICRLGIKEYRARKFPVTLDVDSYAHLREMTPGDILVDESNVAYIHTPQFQWSIVELIF